MDTPDRMDEVGLPRRTRSEGPVGGPEDRVHAWRVHRHIVLISLDMGRYGGKRQVCMAYAMGICSWRTILGHVLAAYLCPPQLPSWGRPPTAQSLPACVGVQGHFTTLHLAMISRPNDNFFCMARLKVACPRFCVHAQTLPLIPHQSGLTRLVTAMVERAVLTLPGLLKNCA
jgi:hypothetical protein